MVCQSTGKMGQTCRNDVGRVVRWRKWYLECVSAIGVRSSGYNTKGRGCNVQERFRLRPSHENDYGNGDNNGNDGNRDSSGSSLRGPKNKE